MQRASYGQSPPLHHPVPQHVSTVPQLRSPPPPTGSAQSQQHAYGAAAGAGNPYQQQGGSSGNVFGAYGQFMNDPTAHVAAQLGSNAFKQGQEYMEQNISRFVSVSALKHYFNVSNSYVVNKLFLVLFPWRHKPWSRKHAVGANGQEGWYLPPREDINSPDMYIPVMALVTYILLSTLIAGLRGHFQPELLGYTASTSFFVVVVEIVALQLGCYILSISSQSQLLDLVAYSGYKFVGIIVTIIVAEVFNGGTGTGGWVGWTIFLYTFLANSLFLMRSLKYVLLPESPGNSGGPMQIDSRAKRNQRTQFLFFYSYIVQLFFISSPITAATLQAALLGAISNVLAQLITVYKTDAPLAIDWIPVFQFVLFNIIATPPNYLWQDTLESSFPAHPAPSKQSQKEHADDKKKKKQDRKQPEPELSVKNTLIKFLLDQTLGAASNTLLFCFYARSLQVAMAGAPRVTNFFKAVSYWTSPGTIELHRVDFGAVLEAALDDCWPMITAGWKLWPAISLINFTLVKTVQGRNLVGSLAGLAWGVYVSLASSS
ncbi:transport protein yif1 [Stachybotrys elegans]|uniref:Transport protein yif1 n=1 Tax=Stachybotrys elegans TaxID=80388 RepID=A0A8K0SLY9_9HYPO|nr:transport protein yif1 [Stachybotrys elegans]